MDTPREIIKIADIHLAGAKSLLKDNYHKSAFYLAGYSVELYFKAKICVIWGIDNLFSDDFGKNNTSYKDFKEICKAVKTHNLSILLAVSGLKHKYKQLKTDDPQMFTNASFIINYWKETERYKLNTSISNVKIRSIINNLEDFLKWIEKN